MKQVFLDIDTQIDFMFPAGALYVPGAEKLIPEIARLNRHAMANGIPLVSTMCAHAENDPEFREWPPHCVVGTVGQLKPSPTLAGQTIFEKRQLDVFKSPNFAGLLRDLAADEYVVYGVATEHCVRLAAMGLLAAGKRVIVLEDAIRHIEAPAKERFLEEFRARGGACASGYKNA